MPVNKGPVFLWLTRIPAGLVRRLGRERDRSSYEAVSGPCMQIPNSSCLLFSLVPSDDDGDENEDDDEDDDGDDDDVKHERYDIVEKASALQRGGRG